MKLKSVKNNLFVLFMTCLFCFSVMPVYAEPQGTDGTEVQVMEAEKLEIQLGADWAGVEFQMKTDAGMYPGKLVVGKDGVLRTEIGGSSSYVLTCMNSSVSVPKLTQAPATTEQHTDSDSGKMDSGTDSRQANTVAGIPVLHVVLFGGGMVIAVGGLIAMRVVKKRREADWDYEDEDEGE